MYLRIANIMEKNNWITICVMSDVTAIGFDDIFPLSVYFKNARRTFDSCNAMSCHPTARSSLSFFLYLVPI